MCMIINKEKEDSKRKVLKTHLLRGIYEMEVLNKWLLRIEYLLLIAGFFIIAGNVFYLLQTGDISKISTFYLFIREKYMAIASSFHSLTQNQVSTIVLCLVAGLFILGLYKYKKALLQFGLLIVGTTTFVGFVFYPNVVLFVKTYYLQNHGSVALFSVLLLLLVGRFLLFSQQGRSFLMGLIKFTIELYVLFTIIYYVGTMQFSKITLFFYSIWSELSFSLRFISFYLDVSMIVFIGLIVLMVNMATITGVVNYHKRRKELKTRGFTSDEILPHIGITIPAYNEEEVIIATVEAALQTNYPANKKDIVVVCDGSQDSTCQKLIKAFDMHQLLGEDRHPALNWIRTKPITGVWASHFYPNLKVIYKLNGGKHDALNCGLNFHRKEVTHVMNLDADTLLEENAVRQLAVEVARNRKELLAVAGTILPEYRSQSSNSFKDWLLKMKTKTVVEWQRLDYLSSFHVSRGSLALINAIFIISGAFGLFNRQALLSLMGYRKGLGEDMDITLQIQKDSLKRKTGKIAYIPEAVAYTAAPLTLKELSKQRIRWFKGLMECLLRFKSLLFSRLSFAYLQFVLVEFLTPIFIPIGILNIIARPEMLSSPVFQVTMLVLILSSIISTIVGIWLESRYRPVKKHLSFFIFTQILITPLSFLWRNDAFLQFKDKSWGAIRKTFN